MLFFFFFNDTATTEIYTLSLHDALPIYLVDVRTRQKSDAPIRKRIQNGLGSGVDVDSGSDLRDRKSTRLNSSHSQISYAVFCLKKKNTHTSRSVAPPSRRRAVLPLQNDA